MMNIGLVSNPKRDPGWMRTREVITFLQQAGATVWVDPQVHDEQLTQVSGIRVGDYATCEVTLSLGGDGTLLSAARLTHPWNLPLLGINFGSMGFMTQVDRQNWQQGLEALLSKKWTLDPRMQLDVRAYNQAGEKIVESFAVNDAVLSRLPFERIATYHLEIGGEGVESIPGDGVIVSTPTGSTGYAMGAGGPIIDPRLQALEVTPLCPHTLHNRSYVVSPDQVIKLTLACVETRAYLGMDGKETAVLREGDWVEVRRHPQPLNLIQLEDRACFSRMPDKIHQRFLLERERKDQPHEKGRQAAVDFGDR